MAIATSSITTWNNDGSGTWAELGSQSSSQNTNVFLTSTGSRAKKVSNSTKGFMYQINASGQDMSAQVVCIRWATLAGVGSLGTRTSGGVSLAIQDTSGNVSYWDVDGNDTYSGGWKVTVVDIATTPSRNNGTAATKTAIEYVGMEWTTTATVGGGDPNCYIDQVLSWPNTGVVVTGNSTSTLADFVDTLDSSQGIWERRSGKLFSRAKMVLQPDASDMSDTDEDLTFENPVYDAGSTIDATLSEIGLTCSDTDNVTLTRCTITSAGPDEAVTTDANREFDISSATDFDLTTCIIKGFDGTAAVSLGGTGQAITGVTFQDNAQVTDTGAVIRDCTFRNSTTTTGSYLWDNTNTDLQDSAFDVPSGGHGIEHDTIESVYTGSSTNSGSETTTLESSTSDFTTGTPVAVGEYIYNETDGSYGKITVITDSDTLQHEALQGGTNDYWTSGDAFSISPAQTYTNLTFSGAGDDVNNTATGSDGLIISKTGTSNPTTATGNVALVGAVTVKVTVVDKNNNGVGTAQTSVHLSSDDSEVLNGDTNGSGVISGSFTGSTPASCYVRVRKGSGGTNYTPFSTTGTIQSSTGLDVTVVLQEDVISTT